MIGSQDLLPQVIAAQAAVRPDAVYLDEIGMGAQTYGQTDLAGRQWAGLFRDLGVGHESRVLTLMPPSTTTVNVWLGLGWLRATLVPINTEFRGHMLQYVVRASRAQVMLCAERFLADLLDLDLTATGVRTLLVHRETDAPLPEHGHVTILDARALLSTAPVADDVPGPSPHDIATMMFTSGTTGASKGVLAPWASFALGGARMGPPDGLTSSDAMYCFLPLYHVGGTYWLNAMAQSGGRVVMRERFSQQTFWDDVIEHGCTVTFLLGATATFLHQAPATFQDADNPLRSVEMVPLLADVADFESRFGVRVYTVYGSTEIGVVMRSEYERPDARSCGRPFEEFEVRVADELDQELPVGSAGELLVRPRAPWISFAGYFDMPQQTADAWRNLWFHTGDSLYRDEAGNYYFYDRIKDSIRRRGENISSAEVEAYLSGHPEIQEVAAFPVPSEWGEDEVKVCLVLTAGSRRITPEDVSSYLKQRSMPKFMQPRFIEMVDELPKTPTGKIRKSALRETHDPADIWDREARERRPVAVSPT